MPVLLRQVMLIFGMRQTVGEIAIIGEQNQPLAVYIQTSNRVNMTGDIYEVTHSFAVILRGGRLATSDCPQTDARNQRTLRNPATEDALTTREMEILRYLARGLSNQEIADELEISITTVVTHVRNILGKLHLANRTQAALYAVEWGISSQAQG